MLIALLTDFGTRDGFVGAMKGVIHSINPGVHVVDISHEVEPFNVLEGALILKAHYRYFPRGTIFIAVVDPGVGSERKPIAVKSGGYVFVGPDNGIFDLVVKDSGTEPRAVLIENPEFMLERVNNTFHGRDIFAPAGAYISRGVSLDLLGRAVTYEHKLNFPACVETENMVEGEIIYFDRFGNAVTNVPCNSYKKALFRGREIKVVSHFKEGKSLPLCSVCGSFGFMELFVYMGCARERHSLRPGEKITFIK